MLETADMVLKNAKILNVFTGEIMPERSLAVRNGIILGWGAYGASQEIDLGGMIAVPGLIDGHVHLESSMVTPAQFARAVVPRGTTAVIADPHEIANVSGNQGIKYIMEASEGLPLKVFIDVPSCVPATTLEDSGAVITAEDVACWMKHPRVVGLGEVMDVPAVLREKPEMLAKIKAALERGKVVDGHAPGLSGTALAKYRSFGISSDHECTNLQEALEKLSMGFHLMLREGTATKNLLSLLPAVTAENLRNCLLVTDDRHPGDLLNEGHLDHLIRLAVKSGLDAVSAVRMATINTAEHFGLKDLGAIAPGYRADLVILSDIDNFTVEKVFHEGRLVAEKGRLLLDVPVIEAPGLRRTCRIAPLDASSFKIAAEAESAVVMELVPRQIITRRLTVGMAAVDGEFLASAEKDLAKLAVIERHKASGRIGKGLLKGFGMKQGALASTIAHDAHNLVVVGMDDSDMLLAAETVAEMGGGLSVVKAGKVLESLPLEIAGLMSVSCLEDVQQRMSVLYHYAYGLGIKDCFDPFLTMAFMSLAVIPELKVTDRGLVDVTAGEIIAVSAKKK